MLLIHQEAEKRLAAVRKYMDRLDEAAFNRGTQPLARVGLEDKLNYLRTYSCRVEDTEDDIDESKSVCLLYPDHSPFCFGFQIKKRPKCEPFLFYPDRAFSEFQNNYYKLVIAGGLIWSGPKTLEDFLNSPVMRLQKDDWSTHT